MLTRFAQIAAFVFLALQLKAQIHPYYRQLQSSYVQEPLASGHSALGANYNLGPQNFQIQAQYNQFILAPFYASVELFGGYRTWSENIVNTGSNLSSNGGWGFGLGAAWQEKENPEWTYDLKASWRFQVSKVLAEGANNEGHSIEFGSEEIQVQFITMRHFEKYQLGFGLALSSYKAYKQKSSLPMIGRKMEDNTMVLIYADRILPEVELNRLGFLVEPNLQLLGPLCPKLDFLIQVRAAISLIDNGMDPVPYVLSGGLKWTWGKV